MIALLVFFAASAIAPATPLTADSIADLRVPRGYERIAYPAESYSGWVQRLPLKDTKTILTYRGVGLSPRIYDRMAVIDSPLLFSEDLEQCADYCMRFWADFHRESGRLEQLFLYSYAGEKRLYRTSGLEYLEFLRQAFSGTNSYSLREGCVEIDAAELRPGDMIVQNDTGGIGHVSMIVDACESSKGDRLFLIGFSFMPAQEFHIERAPSFLIQGKSMGVDGWFSIDGYLLFLDTYMPYGKPVFRRFE